jgi:hypothetical protein
MPLQTKIILVHLAIWFFRVGLFTSLASLAYLLFAVLRCYIQPTEATVKEPKPWV